MGNRSSTRGPQRLKKVLVMAAGALAFVAAVLANSQTIIDFWKKNVAEDGSIEPLPDNAKTLPIPEDEPSPMSNAPVSRREIESPHNASTLAGFHVFGSAQASAAAAKAKSPLVVEAVQSPSEGSYLLTFDIFLHNTSSEDLLLTDVDYDSVLVIPHGDSVSGKVLPTALYNITYSIGGGAARKALSPPFRITANGRSAIRINFKPQESRQYLEQIEGMTHIFEAWLVDSQGRTKKVVQLQSCLNPDGGGCPPPKPVNTDDLFPKSSKSKLRKTRSN